MTATEIPVDNGVNVEALLGVRDTLAGTPEIAQFQWRSTVSWVNGTHSRSDVETFYGFGEEQQHHTRFSYGYLSARQVAAMLEDYADASAAPVLTGTTVTSVRAAGGGYVVRTDQGSWRAPTVVLASGAATAPAVPALARLVPARRATPPS
jgi:glycine/D-amino acid oxidase-like deaminating enzyme